MPQHKQLLDTSSQLHVITYGNGIKLIRPDRYRNRSFNEQKINLTVADLLKQPFCVYFSDTQSAVRNMNEHALVACQFDSLNDAVGKTMFDVATKETATYVTNSHKEVLKTKRIKIIEEDIIKKDAASFQCLTTILPLYNQDNQMIGIFGCTIIPGSHSLAASLEQMSNLGILNSPSTYIREQPLLPSLELDNIYLSKRETECLALLANGKTAKEISIQLGLSCRTVEHYIENIKNKMGVSTKSELILRFYNH